MNRALSCAPVYPQFEQNRYATEYDDKTISFVQVGKVDVRSYGLQNEVANACLQFFITLYTVRGKTGRKGRNGPLWNRIFELGLCTPKSRSYCYDGLKELEEKGLIERSRRKLPGNRGGTIEFRVLPSEVSKTKVQSPCTEGCKVLFLPLSYGAPSVAKETNINKSKIEKIHPTYTDNCPPVHEKDTPLTRGKREETSLCDPKLTVLKPPDARRSDDRTKGVKTEKKENSEVRFTQILTKSTSTRKKNRVLNWLLTDLYRIAFRELGGKEARWILGRAVVEIGCPDNPFHSGVEWEQLSRHYSEMTKGERGERTGLIHNTILPLLSRKPDHQTAAAASGISDAGVDNRKAEMKAAAARVKDMLSRGTLTEKEALEMLRAQEHLINWRKWRAEAGEIQIENE